jgi:hypothetical protein
MDCCFQRTFSCKTAIFPPPKDVQCHNNLNLFYISKTLKFGRYGRKAGRHDSELIAFFASSPANSGNEPYHEVHLMVQKFNIVLSPGCHCVQWCCGVNVAGVLSLRIQQLDVQCETKSKVWCCFWQA